MKTGFYIAAFLACFIWSCSPFRQLNRSARTYLIYDAAFKTAHLGVSIFEPATGKFWYNYQGDKYFVPASNTKLATCFAAMKYLGDSLDGIEVKEYPQAIVLIPTGDPTLLHEDYKNQPVYDFVKTSHKSLFFFDPGWQEQPLGSGWAWNDYEEDYMPERSAFPVYGDLVHFKGRADSITVIPGAFRAATKNALPGGNGYISSVHRLPHANEFFLRTDAKSLQQIGTPFITSDSLNWQLFADSLHVNVSALNSTAYQNIIKEGTPQSYVIHSQPTDSLLAPMMHRSDNFFAEQSLLMVSNKLLHVFNDEKIIDTLLKTDFLDLPQPPRWADGSGLSRYNLFTPQDFVAILNKMRTSFGMERIKTILPTGGTGTLSRYFKADAGYLFAKTGSLSGVVSLSGFLYTKKNHLLIFSILVNNSRSSATSIRKAEERFLEELRNEF